MKTIKYLIIPFLKKNVFFLLGIVIVLFFFFVVIFSLLVSSPSSQQTPQPHPSISIPISVAPRVIYPTTYQFISPAPTSYDSAPEEDKDTYEHWGPTDFSENLFQGISYEKKQLPDGTIRYIISSSDPSRPDMMIVKNGIVIFKRMVLSQMKVTNYLNAYKKPDYIAVGSQFYGPDTITYLYFERGVGFVGNPKTDVAYEDLEFKPVPPSEYKKLYGDDLIGELQKQ